MPGHLLLLDVRGPRTGQVCLERSREMGRGQDDGIRGRRQMAYPQRGPGGDSEGWEKTGVSSRRENERITLAACGGSCGHYRPHWARFREKAGLGLPPETPGGDG